MVDNRQKLELLLESEDFLSEDWRSFFGGKKAGTPAPKSPAPAPQQQQQQPPPLPKVQNDRQQEREPPKPMTQKEQLRSRLELINNRVSRIAAKLPKEPTLLGQKNVHMELLDALISYYTHILNFAKASPNNKHSPAMVNMAQNVMNQLVATYKAMTLQPQT